MAFNEVWDETDPDGDTTTISKMDDQDRLIKRAVRERLEGDPANANSGIYESGSFGTTAIVKAGSARAYAVQESAVSGLTKQDGRIAITTDTGKVFHLAAGGVTEVSYLNLNGSRAMSGNLPMGGHNITGLAAATAADHAVRFDQVLATKGAVLNGDFVVADDGSHHAVLSLLLPSSSVWLLSAYVWASCSVTGSPSMLVDIEAGAGVTGHIISLERVTSNFDGQVIVGMGSASFGNVLTALNNVAAPNVSAAVIHTLVRVGASTSLTLSAFRVGSGGTYTILADTSLVAVKVG